MFLTKFVKPFLRNKVERKLFLVQQGNNFIFQRSNLPAFGMYFVQGATSPIDGPAVGHSYRRPDSGLDQKVVVVVKLGLGVVFVRRDTRIRLAVPTTLRMAFRIDVVLVHVKVLMFLQPCVVVDVLQAVVHQVGVLFEDFARFGRLKLQEIFATLPPLTAERLELLAVLRVVLVDVLDGLDVALPHLGRSGQHDQQTGHMQVPNTFKERANRLENIADLNLVHIPAARSVFYRKLRRFRANLPCIPSRNGLEKDM